MEKDKTSKDTLWVAFGVRSVVARVTTTVVGHDFACGADRRRQGCDVSS